jgi:hypothetical protein
VRVGVRAHSRCMHARARARRAHADCSPLTALGPRSARAHATALVRSPRPCPVPRRRACGRARRTPCRS